MSTKSIDIYLNYSCNFRCVHCFLGESLNNKMLFSQNDVKEIVSYCINKYKTNEVVLLGGEPTLHKEINKIISNIYDDGIRNIRLITNGGKTCEHFIENYKSSNKPKLVFSIDGSNKKTHDAIRGEGAFEQLTKTIRIAKNHGFQFDAITSICSINYNEVCEVIDFLDNQGFGSVTFHYVTPRETVAIGEIQLSPSEWLVVRESIVRFRSKTNLSIRFDTIFSDSTELTNSSSCKIKDKSNLMFFPDGKVYLCGLFIGSSYTSGFSWKNGEVIENSVNSEISCASTCDQKCSGIPMVLSESKYFEELKNYSLSCMYDKDTI